MKKLGNVLSLCDGKGGGLDSLHDNGVYPENYFACEFDKYALVASKAVHPEIIQMGDMLNWREWGWIDLDLMVLTLPCQSHSIQGKRDGLESNNGNLINVGLDIIERYRPKMIQFENVKGLLSSSGGMVMKMITDRLSDLGYAIDWKVMNSALTSAQARERVYLIACNTIDKIELKQPEYRGLNIKDIMEDNHGQVIRDCVEVDRPRSRYTHIVAESTVNSNYNSSIRIYSADNCAPTVNTMQGGKREVKVYLENGKFRYLSLREHFRLMGQPEDVIDKLLASGLSTMRLKKICGNGVERGAFAHVNKCLLSQAGYL